MSRKGTVVSKDELDLYHCMAPNHTGLNPAESIVRKLSVKRGTYTSPILGVKFVHVRIISGEVPRCFPDV